jgi:prophage antirepressor-like protein
MEHQLKTQANPFQFSDLDIRTATDEHSEVRFCTKDVCIALDIAWSGSGSSATLESMLESWLMGWKLQTIQGERDAYFINEAGLYHLIFRFTNPGPKSSPAGFAKRFYPRSAAPVSSHHRHQGTNQYIKTDCQHILTNRKYEKCL